MALALTVEKDAHGKLPDAVKALYVADGEKFKLDVDGIEDTAGLKSALAKERELVKAETKTRKALEDRFKDIDPDEVRKMMERLGGDEEAQLIKAGKIDEVVAKRTEKQRTAWAKEMEKAGEQVKASNERAAKFSERVLDNHIRAAAGKAGIHVNAVDDALFRARTMFSLNEDGDAAIQLDKDGHPVFGKDGKTPFGPAEWLEGMKETAPHWFPAGGSGGGAGGDRGGKSGAKTMKRSVFEALDQMERAAFTKDGGKIVD